MKVEMIRIYNNIVFISRYQLIDISLGCNGWIIFIKLIMRLLWKFIILSFTIPFSSPLSSIEFCFEGLSACFSSRLCSSSLLLRLPHSLCHFNHLIFFTPLSPIHRHLSHRFCCSLSWDKNQLLSSFLRFSWVFFLLCFQPLELDWSTMLVLAQVHFH